MARTDDIDEVVSSVRDFVSYKDKRQTPSRILADLLLLTPEQRVVEGTDEFVKDTAVSQTDGAAADNVLALNVAKQNDRAGLEATIAELEAAVTAQSDDWEADEGEEFAQSAWAVSAFDAPAADDGAPVQTDDIDTESLETAIAAKVASDLGEEALRALVVATVHEELSGELGERITRNVRKLVRREINRVLTSREMGEG